MQKTIKLTVQAEHGWSLLAETADGLILFDLGQSDLFRKNAAILGCDLEKVDKVVLSHGHYDHTGGLDSFLSLNPGATIYAHPDVFKKRFSVEAGKKTREIGMPDTVRKYLDSFCLNPKPSQIFPDVFLTGEIRRKSDPGEINKGLYSDLDGKELDYVLDDQAIILNTGLGFVVLLGCCHSGLANTLESVAEITGERQFYMVLGGMHLSKAPEDILRETVQCLNKFHVKKVGHAHCSGWLGMQALKQFFSGEVFSCDVGKTIKI
jgi:7,8-dihydropterin-6-yl-methyl-4-(beta-D-ribofuranosyl)aminobenzene 5'-phosphate synthase